VRASQHRGVLAGAVVVKPRGPLAGIAHGAGPTRRHRLVRAAGEVSLLEAKVVQHRFGDRHMLGLPAV
jgi:hypothetical protein